MSKLKIMAGLLVAILLSGCAYTESAIQYAQEGTKRVESGYTAKLEMTKAVVEYMKVANANCGTNMKVENGIPIVNVKQCVDFDDAMKVVQATPIVKPQRVADIVESAGDFLAKGGSTIVGGLGVYYGHKTSTAQLEYQYKNNVVDSNLQQGMWSTYTDTYSNNSVEVVSPTTVTNETVEVVNPIVVEQPIQIVEPTIVETTTNNYTTE